MMIVPRRPKKLDKKLPTGMIPVRGVLPTRLDSPEFRSEMRFNKQSAEEQVQNRKKALMRRGASEADAEKEVRRLLRQAKEQREKWADETFGRFVKKK